MNDRAKADLHSLFAQPAALNNAATIERAILLKVDAHLRRRRLWLLCAGLAGTAVPLVVAALIGGWSTVVEAATPLGTWLAQIVLLIPFTQYGLWVFVAIGSLITLVAARRDYTSL